MAAVFKGAQCAWGTTSTHSSGTVVDESLKKTAQTEPVEDSQGAMTGLVIYDEHYSGTLTIVAASAGASLPNIGDKVTVLGASLYVTDVENKGTHKGKRMFTISCTGGKALA